jgi:hypothetical protein
VEADRQIDRGSTIVVVQAHANRVLVRAVEA